MKMAKSVLDTIREGMNCNTSKIIMTFIEINGVALFGIPVHLWLLHLNTNKKLENTHIFLRKKCLGELQPQLSHLIPLHPGLLVSPVNEVTSCPMT